MLRVKNKLNNTKKSVISFSSADMKTLIDLAENIAYQYSIEQKFIDEEKEKENEISKQQKENEDLTEFLRTYRHEIKTPLTLITTASTRIKNRLIDSGLVNENTFPKKIQEVLTDLEVVGSRLTYVANSLTFNPQELVKDIQKHFLFKDVVIPIAAFSKLYAQNKDRKFDIDIESLNLPPIMCDMYSSQIAFHVLIDNAIKYSKPGSTIFVYGSQDRDFCKVTVEDSSSVGILEFEKEHLFHKYYRAEEVKLKKFEGSGIGLYLAQEIMLLNKGKIELSNLSSPTRFNLFFKKI